MIISADVNPEVVKRLDEIANEKIVKRSDIIRWALIEYVRRNVNSCLTHETNAPTTEQIVESVAI